MTSYLNINTAQSCKIACDEQSRCAGGLGLYRFKKSGYAATLCPRLKKFLLGPVLVLQRRHLTMTRRAEGPQIVDVALAASVGHRQHVVNVPELERPR